LRAGIREIPPPACSFRSRWSTRWSGYWRGGTGTIVCIGFDEMATTVISSLDRAVTLHTDVLIKVNDMPPGTRT
jgi:hypothetical protein